MNIFGRMEQSQRSKATKLEKEISSKKYSNYNEYEKDINTLSKHTTNARYLEGAKKLTTKSSGGAVNTLGNNISSLSKQKPPKAKKRFNLSL